MMIMVFGIIITIIGRSMGVGQLIIMHFSPLYILLIVEILEVVVKKEKIGNLLTVIAVLIKNHNHMVWFITLIL